MAITVKTQTLNAGGTKVLSVTPSGDAGPIVPDSLVAKFTPASGDPVTKTLSDFTKVGDAYSLDFTFLSAGPWTITIKATDAAGRSRVVEDRIYVHSVEPLE